MIWWGIIGIGIILWPKQLLVGTYYPILLLTYNQNSPYSFLVVLFVLDPSSEGPTPHQRIARIPPNARSAPYVTYQLTVPNGSVYRTVSFTENANIAQSTVWYGVRYGIAAPDMNFLFHVLGAPKDGDEVRFGRDGEPSNMAADTQVRQPR